MKIITAISRIRFSFREAKSSIFCNFFSIFRIEKNEKDVTPILFKKSSTGRIIADATIINKLPKKAAEPNLNWETQLITAIGAVVKTPDTTNVAPVSPKDLAKARTVPEKIAGRVNGIKIFLKVVRGEAPKVPEACSRSVDISSSLALRVFTMYGKVRAICITNIKRGTLIKGITESI